MKEQPSEKMLNTKATLFDVISGALENSAVLITMDLEDTGDLALEVTDAIMERASKFNPDRPVIIFRDSNALLLEQAYDIILDRVPAHGDLTIKDWLHEAEYVLQSSNL